MKGYCLLGGAISNMYAMLLARYKMFPEVKEKGMSSVPRLVAFTSEHVRLFFFCIYFLYQKSEIIIYCK